MRGHLRAPRFGAQAGVRAPRFGAQARVRAPRFGAQAGLRAPRFGAQATLIVAALLLLPAVAAAQPSIILVRHAERQTGEGDDSLSDAGRQRAERLATILREAGITHIFVSDLRRTLETAQPVAKNRNISPSRIAIPREGRRNVTAAELQVRATLLAISKLPRTAVVLVVGHSNTVPMFLARLGHTTPVRIEDNEFDNLFVVTQRATRAPSVVRLHF